MSEFESEGGGELRDLGQARHEQQLRGGVPVSALDKLFYALRAPGDRPTSLTVEDLERIISSPDADEDVKAAARQIKEIVGQSKNESSAEPAELKDQAAVIGERLMGQVYKFSRPGERKEGD
jgi:hypothetical protein